jgi:hypothetical protein
MLLSEKVYDINRKISIQIMKDKPLDQKSLMNLNLELGDVIIELRRLEEEIKDI